MSAATEYPTSKKPSRASVLWAVLLMVTGFFALALPWEASLGVVLVIGWVLILGCGLQVIHALQSRGLGNILWKLLIALLYLGAGIYFLTHPLLGVATLTFALAIFFFVKGVMDLMAYFKERKSTGAGWIFWNGAVTLILGLMIWRHWPSSSLWAIGTLLGVNLLMNGITLLMITVAARRLRVAAI
jgi:uncharacterized membrane protein HdeD (DUF308 family)